MTQDKKIKESCSSRPSTDTDPSDNLNGVDPQFIVGIGSSAGGVEALIELLASIPTSTPHAFVIVQHMSPEFKTMLPELLSRHSGHHVEMAFEGAIVKAGGFYLIPPKFLITIFHGRLLLHERLEDHPESFFPINYFFESLSKDAGSKAIGIILSGTGSDGTIGIQHIKKNDGHVIVQTPDSAKFAGMPRSAIASNLPDVILPLNDIARYLEEFASGIRHEPVINMPKSANGTSIDKVFLALRNVHGIDFSNYNDDLVQRRMGRRAQIAGCQNLDQYCELVVKNSAELDRLYDDLLLGVTRFFREPESLELLNSIVLPRVSEAMGHERDLLRIWVVGCSTGEEAFTIAFIIEDFLKSNQLQLDYKIFATDVDDKSLRIASRAIYPVGRIASLSKEWQDEYFRIKDGQAHVRSSIREQVVFANHNVIKDAPFPSIDLISCRNLMVYLKPEIKEKVVQSFQFSLQNQGFLLLGQNEGLSSQNTAFQKLKDDFRLFQCVKPGRSYTGIRHHLSSGMQGVVQFNRFQKKAAEEDFLGRLHSKLVNEYFYPAIVFNQEFEVEFYYGNVKEFCNPFSGRASHRLSDVLPDHVFSVVETLRSALSSQGEELSDTLLVSRASSNQEHSGFLTVRLSQFNLLRDADEVQLFLIKFELSEQLPLDPDELSNKSAKLLQTKLRMLENELGRTKKQLLESRCEMATIVGQLEASNEELRTTNEELQAGSEELQSTNEELQAVNEELYTVNAECQLRITELSEMSSDVQNIYEVSEIGTLFVDKELRIRKFNSFSQRIFNLLPDDIGRPLEHFSSTIKVDFSAKVKRVLESMRIYQKEIKSIDGVTYLMRIAPYKTDDLQIKGVVLVFLDISSRKEALHMLSDVSKELALVTQDSSDFIVKFDRSGKMIWANEVFCELFGLRKIDISDELHFGDFFRSDQQAQLRNQLSDWSRQAVKEDYFKYHLQPKTGDPFEVFWHTKAKTNYTGDIIQYVSIGHVEH